jgi:hypothetical protein
MAARALDAEAPYFVDTVSQQLRDQYGSTAGGAVDVYTSLDLHLQRLAHEASAKGSPAWTSCSRAGAGSPRRRRSWPSIRAPARSSRWSAAAPTTSRSSTARSTRAGSRARSSSPSCSSPPSSRPAPPAAPTSRRRRSWWTSRPTSGSTSRPGRRATTTAQFEGPVTLRRTLALSRNIPTIKLAQASRLRRSRPAVARRRRRHAAPPLPLDRPRRVRGHAVRDRGRLHAVRQRRHDQAAPLDPAPRARRPRAPGQDASPTSRLPAPTRPSSSRT